MGFDLSSLPPEPPEKEAERRRRRLALLDGRHPDTNQKLASWNENTLPPNERVFVKREREFRKLLTQDRTIQRVAGALRARGKYTIIGSPLMGDIPQIERKLLEYWANIELFGRFGFMDYAIQRAQILTISQNLLKTLDFDQKNVEIVRYYYMEILTELHVDFQRCQNPVFAIEAIAIARRYDFPFPDWVLDFIGVAAERIMAIREDADGGPTNKEAEIVGKALGFGADRRGGTGRFKSASMVAFDRDVSRRISDELEKCTKLDLAYDKVAAEFTVSRSKIVHSYLRTKKLTEE